MSCELHVAKERPKTLQMNFLHRCRCCLKRTKDLLENLSASVTHDFEPQRTRHSPKCEGFRVSSFLQQLLDDPCPATMLCDTLRSGISTACLQVSVRIVLWLFALAIFTFLFAYQTRSPDSQYLQRSYIKVENTPCSDYTDRCVVNPAGGNDNAGALFTDPRWQARYQSWEKITSRPASVCPCTVISSAARKFVFKAQKLCTRFTRLCSGDEWPYSTPRTNQSSLTWDPNSSDGKCFVTPSSPVAGAAQLFETLQLNDTFRKEVERAGTVFCTYGQELSVFSLGRIIPVLGAPYVWHEAALQALSEKMSQFALHVREPFMESHSAVEMSYVQEYLDWLAYRVIAYAAKEGEGLGGPKQQGINTDHLQEASLLPFESQICHGNNSCEARYPNVTDHTLFWKYDFWVYAIRDCIPIQCSRLVDKNWKDKITALAVLAGGLMNTIFSTLLPLIWSIIIMGALKSFWGFTQ